MPNAIVATPRKIFTNDELAAFSLLEDEDSQREALERILLRMTIESPNISWTNCETAILTVLSRRISRLDVGKIYKLNSKELTEIIDLYSKYANVTTLWSKKDHSYQTSCLKTRVLMHSIAGMYSLREIAFYCDAISLQDCIMLCNRLQFLSKLSVKMIFELETLEYLFDDALDYSDLKRLEEFKFVPGNPENELANKHKIFSEWCIAKLPNLKKIGDQENFSDSREAVYSLKSVSNLIHIGVMFDSPEECGNKNFRYFPKIEELWAKFGDGYKYVRGPKLYDIEPVLLFENLAHLVLDNLENYSYLNAIIRKYGHQLSSLRVSSTPELSLNADHILSKCPYLDSAELRGATFIRSSEHKKRRNLEKLSELRVKMGPNSQIHDISSVLQIIPKVESVFYSAPCELTKNETEVLTKLVEKGTILQCIKLFELEIGASSDENLVQKVSTCLRANFPRAIINISRASY